MERVDMLADIWSARLHSVIDGGSNGRPPFINAAITAFVAVPLSKNNLGLSVHWSVVLGYETDADGFPNVRGALDHYRPEKLRASARNGASAIDLSSRIRKRRV